MRSKRRQLHLLLGPPGSIQPWSAGDFWWASQPAFVVAHPPATTSRCDQKGRQDQQRPAYSDSYKPRSPRWKPFAFCFYRFRANSHRDALIAPTSSPTKTSTLIGIAATFCVAASATRASDHENHPSCFTAGWSSSKAILRCGSSAGHPGSGSWIWSNAGIILVDVDLRYSCWASICFPFYAPAAMGCLRGLVVVVSSLCGSLAFLRVLPATGAWLFGLLTTGQ